MNNDKLIKLRALLSQYTDDLLAKVKEEQLPLFPEPIARLELVNFIDRANQVVFDLERQITVG